MTQTENTAIVLRHADYHEYDRMVTLLSPTRGRIDAAIRNCRKPKSHNLNAGELFALGDYMLVETAGRHTVTSVNLIETFYPLRADYDRLTCGIYLLNLTEAVIEPEQPEQELFMLLLHTLSRLTFSDQPAAPLLSGFLLHFSVCEGFQPRLHHCVHCGQIMENGPFFFDAEAGGLCCADCRTDQEQLSPGQVIWMREALQTGASGWINSEDKKAPFAVLRHYVESHLSRKPKSAALLPEDESFL